LPEAGRSGGFGLYLHWPFCQAKCPYCDFNSHVSGRIDHRRWQAALISEIDRHGRETSGRILNSVFFGGGTPGLMPPDLVAALLDRIRRTWQVANDLEVTLEANPTSVESSLFQGFRDAGVNRISIGIQALDDAALRALGRLHDTARARAALETARAVFSRVSFDLIYARQHQSLSGWKTELREALEMTDGHLSLYQLTIEPGTAFGRLHARGALPGLPDEDLAADMYLLAQEMCEAAGLPAYEISNHARPGDESRHNMIYWTAGDYVGIGPGAHGRLSLGGKRLATEALSQPERWLSQVEALGHGEASRRSLSRNEQLAEYLMMGLRLRAGLDETRLSSLCVDDDLFNKINTMKEAGLLERCSGKLRATSRGRLLLDALLRELLPVEG